MEAALRPLRLTMVLIPLAILPACAGSGGEKVQMSETLEPTVSYTYKDAGDFPSASSRASTFCYERYSNDAELLETTPRDGFFEAKFRCK